MKREILFKAKRKDNGQWVEGFVINCIPNIRIEPDKLYIVDSTFEWVEVDPDTVSQYIGRTDKNGTEIYDDHKLKNLLCEDGCYDAIYYTPRWDDENLCYMFDCHSYLEERIDYFSSEIIVVDSFRADDIDFSTLELIGSIHDEKGEV